MITFGEAIQRVQSLYSRGVQSVDSRLTPQHIYSALRSARSILIGQQLDRSRYVSEWVYQTIPCVELITAPIHECPCAPVAGKLFLRSKFPIPKTISGPDNCGLKAITTLDGTTVFDKSTFETEKYAAGHKYTASKPTAYIRNQYLYITQRRLLRSIPLTGLFEDPIEVLEYPIACQDDINDTCNCIDIYDEEFPFDDRKVKALVSLANEELIFLLKQMTEDKNPNSDDDTASTGMIHRPQPTTDAEGN